jgi:DNA-binding NarL/FixJ family response regulator
VLVFSQYIETWYAARLLAAGAAGVGYLLKDRVANVATFTDALARVAAGGTAFDPEVVTQLVRHGHRREDLRSLTAREREVLGLMAQGRTNAAIAQTLTVSLGTVEARGRHLRQARPPGIGGRQPPRARRPRLPAGREYRPPVGSAGCASPNTPTLP